jgi:hypothetical protein
MSEHLPSKEWNDARIMDELGDYDACLSPERVEQIFENAHRLLQHLRRENVRWENAHKILLAEVERHKRDVKLLEIVGKEQEQRIAELKRPAHEREAPHCSSCSCPPYEPAAEPTMPGELARHIERKFMVAVMEADDAFQKAGAAGTKTWIRDFLLGRLEANGLGIGMKEHVRAAQPPGDGQ